MSEYQFIHFLAIDRPLDDKQVAFMEKQSSRAEITRWEFTNQYNFGGFHGDAAGMLRHGYDIHLHYANFGTRRLWIRLPAGLPCDRKTFDAFCIERSLDWDADKKGPGGILQIEPEADAGTFEEEVYDPGEVVPKIAPVRGQLIGGDLRLLYIAWLACCYDDEAAEPPVPAGLGKLTPALRAIATFYALSEDLIAAAAQRSPPLRETTGADTTLEDWIARQTQKDLRALVQGLLSGDAAALRAETLSRIRDETGAAAWPMAESTRTLGELRQTAEGVRDGRLHREKNSRDKARRKHLAAIVADPDKVIREVETLVKERSVDSYRRAADQLADLREALGPELGSNRARTAAEGLRQKNPRLNQLVSALRKRGLLG